MVHFLSSYIIQAQVLSLTVKERYFIVKYILHSWHVFSQPMQYCDSHTDVKHSVLTEQICH